MKLVITVTDIDGMVLEHEEIAVKARTEEIIRGNRNAAMCPKVTVQLAWLEDVADLQIPPRCRP